ncbi:YraN family protein [Oscillospiraceae bacterium LTW-04]|nr:YraN family protein [Oscillospiraceae bacterium MB24-C1]
MTQNGALGEQFAAEYLKKQGYRILQTNFNTRFGEIDIIAQKGDILAFVEVKTRAASMLATPAEAVTPAKQKKLIKATLQYLQTHPNDLQPRFDVISIITESKSGFAVMDIMHLTDAFEATTQQF